MLAVSLALAGCSHRPKINRALPFEEAVKIVADDLFIQVKKQRGILDKLSEAVFVIDPIIDSDTGEVTQISAQIKDLFEQEAKKKFQNFGLAEMTSENLSNAPYVISGIIRQGHYRTDSEKMIRLWVSILEKKSGRIIAHSTAWISDKKLEYEPTPIDRDSPVFIMDARVKALIATAKAAAGSIANKEYFESLATKALLIEAGKAYDAGDYSLSLGLHAKAAERPDGQIMKTFRGLYLCFIKLNRIEDAEKAFGKLTDLGIRDNNLYVKMLFQVNKTDFLGSRENQLEYPIWLRQIARTLRESGSCLEISGHASHSGTEEYNDRLSRMRAERIQALITDTEPDLSNKLKAVGCGFQDNWVGTGADDDSDAIDRRVQFRVIACNQPNQEQCLSSR